MKKKAKAEAAASKNQPETAEVVVPPKCAEYERRRIDIETAKVKTAPWNPRGKITPESVADLAASIKSLGMIQPVVAMMDADGGATLVAGHRRLAAAKIAGLETVPCEILVGVDEPTAKRMTFIENLQRRDADPLLESELVGDLVKDGMTQAEIAAETGRGREWVARRANLANLSKSWRKRVKDGEQITTDCLEHVAAYPEEVQEKLKGARGYNGDGALRWGEIKSQFDRETCDLKATMFDRSSCRTCPNNTGCEPTLFDWDGKKPSTFGKCLDAKCYKRKTAEAIEKAKKEAKADGHEVRELKEHPDYSVRLKDKAESINDTLYVWKDWNGETQMKWGGERPPTGSPGGEMTEEQKEARRAKIAANKARRKLAEWCTSEALAVAISKAEGGAYPIPTVWAYQTMFDIGSSWQLFGSRTTAKDAARHHYFRQDGSAPANWPKLVADEIAKRIVKPEIGAQYAELLCALFQEAYDALTEEERRLVVSDEKLAQLQNPEGVKWLKDADDDPMMDEEETEADDE